MAVRRLTLKREVLHALSDADLAAVAGAAPPDTTIVGGGIGETAYSCLHYISCAFLNTCMIGPATIYIVETVS